MAKKQEWLDWIDDQLKDMYKEDGYTDKNINRVFKTEDDDRDIAVYLLEKFRELVEKSNEDI
jgi:hypothetical protein